MTNPIPVLHFDPFIDVKRMDATPLVISAGFETRGRPVNSSFEVGGRGITRIHHRKFTSRARPDVLVASSKWHKPAQHSVKAMCQDGK